MPVSLSRGHVHTSEFVINTRSTYWVGFMAHDGFGHQPGPSDPPVYEYCLPDLGTSWSLSSHGRVVATGAGTPCGDWLGWFKAGNGTYVLDADVSRDGSSFNSRKPRLVVFEDGGLREATYRLGEPMLCTFGGLTTIGAGILIFSAISARNKKLDSEDRVSIIQS